MWIDRAVFAAEHDARIAAEAANASIVAHNVALKSTMDWMTMRLTQLEYERAQLIHQFLGVKIAVPTIEPEPSRVTASQILNETIDFNDMGDDAAAKAGVGWNDLGELVYAK